MSEYLICEFCNSKSKSKHLLTIHQKGVAKCIKMQIEKLGKPLYEASLKKLENKKDKPKKEPKDEPKEESSSESESEEDENQEIPFISSSEEESDIDIQMSESEEETPKEAVKPKFTNSKLLFKKKESSPPKEQPHNTPESRITEPAPRKSLKHPELMSEVNDVKKQEVDTKEIVSSILSALNTKDNKVLEEIKKLRDELKDRDDALRKTITKLEKTLTDCNPLSIIEIIKRIQAEVETKDDLLQIFKEDLEETLDKYYELYKKLKDVKYDMEDMVYGKDKK